MSVYEKRKLVARVTQDPRQMGRLTLRERRELSGMMKSAKDKEDENDR